MNNKTIEDFEIRFYKWSLQEWEYEIDNDFPLLKLVDNEGAQETINVFKYLEKQKQKQLAKALIKRGRNASILLKYDHYFSEDDEKYVQYYVRKSYEESNKMAANRTFQEEVLPKKERKLIKKCILQKLGHIIGEKYEDWMGAWDEWKNKRHIGSWIIETQFDISGTVNQLTYFHNIKNVDDEELYSHISLFGWLGLGSETGWQIYKKEEIEPIVEHLAILCDRFMNVTPKLLKGLTTVPLACE